ncbi:c-type cytochrome [Sedimentitalea nanhaiensis]|uniref:Cytochrome c n=1 Tax=Sedimentitalea nanhaiensis TaxID=999627 RepID=A0A1I6YCV9_9RHOB|nr:cytochrome c [Sedimentitalea nanhaiensis]SFT48242.1 Cytochrome c [Sedimentitalea nanhaiensis]
MQTVRSALAAAAICIGGPALAQDTAKGAELFQIHCATCHGIEAGGQGPMASVLLVKPADLTRLQESNDGVFPTERVIRRIDGRDPLVSHGSPMPVYGYFFEGEDASIKTPSGQPVLTSRAIVDLLGYLQSLQSSNEG